MGRAGTYRRNVICCRQSCLFAEASALRPVVWCWIDPTCRVAGGDPRSRAVTHGQVENSADTEWTCAAGGTEACLLAPCALQAPLGQSQSPRMAVTRNVEARAGDDVGEWLRTRETEMLREEQRTAARQAAARPPPSKIAEQHQSARVSSCNAPSAYAVMSRTVCRGGRCRRVAAGRRMSRNRARQLYNACVWCGASLSVRSRARPPMPYGSSCVLAFCSKFGTRCKTSMIEIWDAREENERQMAQT